MSDEVDEELLQALSDEFEAMCTERHEMGAEKYGPVNFLKVDAFRMAAEEVADLSNYARYLYIKLRLLQHFAQQVQSEGNGSSRPAVLGPDSFIPNKENK